MNDKELLSKDFMSQKRLSNEQEDPSSLKKSKGIKILKRKIVYKSIFNVNPYYIK